MQRLDSPGWLRTADVDRSIEEPERPGQVIRTQGLTRLNSPREYITAGRPGRESEGAVVARKRGNARGAKDPCQIRVFIRGKENRLDKRPTTEESGQPPRKDQPTIPSEVKSGVELPPKVSKLRWKLGQKAKQEPKFRFYTLYDRICRDDVLMTAWWLVLAHNGAPGVDGVSCQDIIDGPGATVFLTELREELCTGRVPAATGQTRVYPQAGRPDATAGHSHG